MSAATWRTTAPFGISGALDVESVADVSIRFASGPGTSEGETVCLSALGAAGDQRHNYLTPVQAREKLLALGAAA